MDRPLLEAKSVSCSRGGALVLCDVSFKLHSGAALIVRGPNGIGKTTLLRCIAGVQSVVTGDINAAPDAIAYAAHSDGLKATLTVRENLEFWAGLFGGGDVDTALGAMDLAALHTRQAVHLSAGQKRRLGLARVLVTNRPIWVLDEPTVSLDAHSVRQFVKILQDHLSKGGAALVATHADLGMTAPVLDLSACRPSQKQYGHSFDEAFL